MFVNQEISWNADHFYYKIALLNATAYCKCNGRQKLQTWLSLRPIILQVHGWGAISIKDWLEIETEKQKNSNHPKWS